MRGGEAARGAARTYCSARNAAAIILWVAVALGLSGCSGEQMSGLAAIWTSPTLQPPPPAASTSASAAAPAEPHPNYPPPPDEVRAEIVRWFSHAGYQPQQVSALVEYVRIESGFRPCATNGSGIRYTFQWSGRRLDQLASFAGTRGCPALSKQLAFADHELRHDPNYACFWDATTPTTAFAALRRGFGYGRC